MQIRGPFSHRLLSITAYAASFIMLFPSDALAWGAITHLDFGLAALSHLALLTPMVRRLLQEYRESFLYGNMAADSVIGKNLAPYHIHCHNWKVGLDVLDKAWTARQKAFSFGYLSHLAADTIAHNYFVPLKVSISYSSRTTRHIYWELRYGAFVGEAVWEEARRLARHDFTDLDSFLQEAISSPLFNFRTSKQIFQGLLLINRLKRWRQMIEIVDRRSPWILRADEVEECKRLSLDATLGFLIDIEEARCLDADPVGARNIKLAMNLRRTLKGRHQKRMLDDGYAKRLEAELKPRFLKAIYHKLELPVLESI